MSFYAATKNLLKIWLIVIRICSKFQLQHSDFLESGPYGRPDMALLNLRKQFWKIVKLMFTILAK